MIRDHDFLYRIKFNKQKVSIWPWLLLGRLSPYSEWCLTWPIDPHPVCRCISYHSSLMLLGILQGSWSCQLDQQWRLPIQGHGAGCFLKCKRGNLHYARRFSIIAEVKSKKGLSGKKMQYQSESGNSIHFPQYPSYFWLVLACALVRHAVAGVLSL